MLRLLAALGAVFLLTSCAGTVSSPRSCLYEHEMAHAGGWPANHPGSIRTTGCGGLPMPPHKFPVRVRPVIKYVPAQDIPLHCGYAQACTYMYSRGPATMWLPQ